MRRALFAVLLGLSGPVAAQPSERAPERVDVSLSSFKFTPATLRLHHGQHYLLRLTNTSGGGHDYAAERFFAAAQLAPATPVAKGVVAVGAHETATIELTAPAAGVYPVRCTHFLHSTFGMKGEIVVD